MTNTGFVSYRVEILHYDSGDLEVHVFDVGDSESDRSSIAWALREAANKVLHGVPINKDKLN
jgi:hypothetical protein